MYSPSSAESDQQYTVSQQCLGLSMQHTAKLQVSICCDESATGHKPATDGMSYEVWALWLAQAH